MRVFWPQDGVARDTGTAVGWRLGDEGGSADTLVVVDVVPEWDDEWVSTPNDSSTVSTLFLLYSSLQPLPLPPSSTPSSLTHTRKRRAVMSPWTFLFGHSRASWPLVSMRHRTRIPTPSPSGQKESYHLRTPNLSRRCSSVRQETVCTTSLWAKTPPRLTLAATLPLPMLNRPSTRGMPLSIFRLSTVRFVCLEMERMVCNSLVLACVHCLIG